MANREVMDPNIIKWLAIAGAIGFVSLGAAESFDSKYKAEAVSSATESWSKIVVACLEAGQEDCTEKYKMVIR